jgi:hypothetical protein
VSLLDWLEPREMDLFPTAQARREAEGKLPPPARWILNLAMYAGVSVAVLMLMDVFPLSGFGRWRAVAKWGFALLGCLMGTVAIGTLALLTRRRRARECRILLCESSIPVCLHCGYDLRGQTEPRCAECGQAFDRSELAGGGSVTENTDKEV